MNRRDFVGKCLAGIGGLIALPVVAKLVERKVETVRFSTATALEAMNLNTTIDQECFDDLIKQGYFDDLSPRNFYHGYSNL